MLVSGYMFQMNGKESIIGLRVKFFGIIMGTIKK
jgi:hypothetical protein